MELHCEPDSWLRLRLEWLRLQDVVEEANPFLTWQWQEAWWRAFGEGMDLRLVTFRDRDELVALAPLCLDAGQVRFCGGLEVTDHLGLLCRPEYWHEVGHALVDLWQERGWGPLDLHFLAENSGTLEALRHAAATLELRAEERPENVSPRLQLPGTWDDYLAGLPRKSRHELKRKIRRLEGVDHRFTTCCEQALQQDLDDFFRLHRLSSAAKADFLDARMETFFRDTAEALHDAGWLGLRFLEIRGARVAAILTFVYRDRILLYNSGYDAAEAPLSPGLMVIAEDIRQAIVEGRHEYDFLRGGESYKYDLGGRDISLLHLRLERP